MRASATRRPAQIVLALVLAGALCAAGTPLAARATPTNPAIEAKKAEEAAVRAELDQMRLALDANVKEYLKVTRLLDTTRAEVAEVNAEIAETDEYIERTRKALVDRSVEIYRGERAGLLALLLDSRSIQDFMARFNYLAAVNSRDARLMGDLRIARNESLWLRQNFASREQRLAELQQEADTRREQIETGIEQQEAKAKSIGEDIAELIRQAAAAAAAGGGQPTGDYSPDTLISDANFRDSASMSVEEIQSFLEQQTGTLASYSAPDHAGTTKSAARMIAEAATAWGVSPKAILVTLQKEQSLLSRKSPTQSAYDWAMGCGKADSRTFYQYQGFGKQIWFGAEKLSKNAGPWKPGIEMTIDGSIVRPTNSSTYSLYKYTPHLKGTLSFWLIYWRYFDDPLAAPTAQPAP